MRVLDHGFIELEATMGGDAAVVRAARLCYDSVATSEEADARLIRHLFAKGHNTPFEHAVFRWHVKCPIFVARQWLRHRICTFNERSLRYCVADREYYIPANESAGRGTYEAQMENSFDVYEALVQQGWPKERARGVLGTAVYTEFLWTVNAWSLMNWLTKRLDKAAQWEHRQYAKEILDIFGQTMPITCKAFMERDQEGVRMADGVPEWAAS